MAVREESASVDGGEAVPEQQSASAVATDEGSSPGSDRDRSDLASTLSYRGDRRGRWTAAVRGEVVRRLGRVVVAGLLVTLIAVITLITRAH